MTFADNKKVYHEIKNSCDGTQKAIVDARSCKVKMDVFWVNPFNLPFGDDILVKLRATNSMGDGETSDEDTAADVQVLPPPVIMGKPSVTKSDDKSLDVSWTQLKTEKEKGANVDIVAYEI